MGEVADHPQTALELKEAGNQAVGRGEHAAAVDLYTSAINLIVERLRASNGSSAKEVRGWPTEDRAALARIHSNRALCYTTIGEHDSAIGDGENLTKLDPSWAKGWYRYGVALREAGGPRHVHI
jgi:tetratricopeptide (TPR) repeat protein